MTDCIPGFGPKQTDWIIALESEDFAQTRHVLMSGDLPEASFCCLGVAQYMFAGPPDEVRSGENGWIGKTDGTLFNSLTQEVMQNLALTEAGMHRCIAMNDAHGYTFPMIAAEFRRDPTFFFSEPR